MMTLQHPGGGADLRKVRGLDVGLHGFHVILNSNSKHTTNTTSNHTNHHIIHNTNNTNINSSMAELFFLLAGTFRLRANGANTNGLLQK